MNSSNNDASAAPAGALAAHSQALAAIVERIGASTLAVRGRRHAVASGVVWREGIVVTAAHVFRRTPAAATLVAGEGRSIEATLVGIDSSTDLAVFRMVGDDALPAVAIGDAASVRAGHFAIAVGRSGDGDAVASAGLVNRASGPWQTWLGGAVDRLIRLDGGVYDGLSGAPVADAHGAVIGIATSALSRHYGIVVPSSTVSRVVDALLSSGHVARPWLGIGAQPVPLPGTGGTGLLVSALVPGGPAERAGLLIGDIVVRAAGEAAADLGALRVALAGFVGKAATLAILRGGDAKDIQIEVGERPTERRCC
ncbi:MAG: S1C family serine protease [Caldimonas sp.]